MDEKIVCGVYVEDGITSPITCHVEEGDVVIEFDDKGAILVENVIVDNPRCTDGINLERLLDAYKADGIIGTETDWLAICGNEVRFYSFKKPLECYRSVTTSFDISYDDSFI